MKSFFDVNEEEVLCMKCKNSFQPKDLKWTPILMQGKNGPWEDEYCFCPNCLSIIYRYKK